MSIKTTQPLEYGEPKEKRGSKSYGTCEKDRGIAETTVHPALKGVVPTHGGKGK